MPADNVTRRQCPILLTPCTTARCRLWGSGVILELAAIAPASTGAEVRGCIFRPMLVALEDDDLVNGISGRDQ